MAYERGKGRGPKGFGGKGGPRTEGRGSFERKPREGGYERRPREDGERKFERKPRAGGSSYGEKRPYAKREGGYGDKKPYGKSFGDKKPYAKREGGYERRPREDGERSYGDKKPYGKNFGDKKPYAKREGGYDRKPREGGFGEKRAFRPREERGDFKYSGPRERFEGERPARPVRGEGRDARFDGKRPVKRERDAQPYAADGWLVGYHAVLAALKAGRRAVRSVWLIGEASGELADVLGAHPEWAVEMKAKPDFETQFGDAVHQGVAVLVGNLPQPSLPELLAQKPKLIVALDQVTDPHNLGAIVRSCAAFGAGGVIVTEHRSAGVNATAAKAAAGAMEVVPVVEVVNLVQSIEMLQEAGFTVIGLAGEAENEIGGVDVKGPLCLVVGSEGDGLRRLTRERCDGLARIAISGQVESLNVSVATGVALSLLTRR